MNPQKLYRTASCNKKACDADIMSRTWALKWFERFKECEEDINDDNKCPEWMNVRTMMGHLNIFKGTVWWILAKQVKHKETLCENYSENLTDNKKTSCTDIWSIFYTDIRTVNISSSMSTLFTNINIYTAVCSLLHKTFINLCQ